MVEVFKTNVNETGLAKILVRLLLDHFPNSRVNFDMDDCDKILRIEADVITPEKIIELLQSNGCMCEILL